MNQYGSLHGYISHSDSQLCLHGTYLHFSCTNAIWMAIKLTMELLIDLS